MSQIGHLGGDWEEVVDCRDRERGMGWREREKERARAEERERDKQERERERERNRERERGRERERLCTKIGTFVLTHITHVGVSHMCDRQIVSEKGGRREGSVGLHLSIPYTI